MIKNYLKTSFRNLLRYKSYSFINIVGLTTGLATSIFIFLWVIDELSYDNFHANGDRIYRVMSNFTYTDGKIETGWATPLKLSDVMQHEIPEIDQTLRLSWNSSMLFKYGEKSLNENGFYADSTIFSIFTFPIVRGNAGNPLPNEKSVAISEKLAHKFFGDEDPVGKVFRVNQLYDLEVSSVFADIPKNSTLSFDFVVHYDLWVKENTWASNWGSNGMQTYATLKPGANLEAANKKIFDIIKKNCKDCINNPFLYPYTELRLRDNFENGKIAGGRIDYIYSLSIVGLIILVIACINFMNLATARSITRSREVGVRKVIGAQRTGLIAQFISESVLLSFLALLLALAVVQFLLPFFNSVTNKSIHIDFTNVLFTGGLIAITLFAGLLAGSYPAFFLSSFKPASVLKGNMQSSLTGGGLRKTLVVVQFVASIILIVGSIVVYNQIQYIQNKHLGFDKENVIVLNQHDGIYKNQKSFKNELLQMPSIKNVGIAGHSPFSVDNTTTDPVWPGKPQGAMISFKVISCDENFIPTLGINMASGRNFVDLNKQDTANYIINEKAMEVMGLNANNVIGTDLEMWNGKGKIIGLVSDFNNGNLRESIMPLVFVYSPENTWRIFVKVAGNVRDALAHIEKVQHKYDPDYPFEYSFLNEDFDREYRNEQVMGKLSLSFTVVAVLISCLGLFGLASFTAERRMKELGVRKVLGASVSNLIVMLCSDFAKLVTVALVIGFPVAWYLMDKYLEGYTFHTSISIWVFILPAIGILTLTIVTVGYQSARAALSNPVKALRSE
ncbi:MAG TPA: ABC transporter permease [Ohtaekwangia sp.]|uniref:ABC transporter permease n=1 Tax=Ohtaekwangia sp. TaxID=2066019 RepID=UPI002F940191